MFRAVVLVRNLLSTVAGLDFGEFTIERVGIRFMTVREVFSSRDVNQDDWILQKSYTHLPAGPLGSAVGGIPNDIEDVLLLLRLFKPGDISFVKLAIVLPNGTTQVQSPYRAMNDLNSYSSSGHFEAAPEECEAWRAFADGIRQSQSWGSGWFAAARRFFLSGGAKQWNPKWDDADRILDYTAALEATLVPEGDLVKRRFINRSAQLMTLSNPAQRDGNLPLMSELYDIRSQIAHGNQLGEGNREWLSENHKEIELAVRQVLRASVQQLPPEEKARRISLAPLYDPTDQDRGELALAKFKEIKTKEVRRAITDKIRELVGKQNPPFKA
jgi:Apea-like HEPN